MNDLAAIKATFADYKRIKTRKVAQLVFEVPLELLHDTIAKLGGEPALHEETWCAIARLNLDASREFQSTPSMPNNLVIEKPKREMTLANRIGILCRKKSFQEFAVETFYSEWKSIEDANYDSVENTKKIVKLVLCVDSLSDILYDTHEAEQWKTKFWLPYEAWLEKQS